MSNVIYFTTREANKNIICIVIEVDIYNSTSYFPNCSPTSMNHCTASGLHYVCSNYDKHRAQISTLRTTAQF